LNSIKACSVSQAASPVSGLGGDPAGTADPNRLKDYSIPYDLALSNKSPVKGGGSGDILSYGICLPKKPIHVQRPCFPANS